MTGFFRDGSCCTGPEDLGSHTICAVVTAEFLDQQVAVVALDLDHDPVHRSAAAAALFQFRRERAEFIAGERYSADQRDALALAALGFAPDPDDSVALRRRGRWLRGLAAPTATIRDRTPAFRAQAAGAGGIDESVPLHASGALLRPRMETALNGTIGDAPLPRGRSGRAQ
jgi:hypothetical protein